MNGDHEILFLSDSLYDAEKMRISTENRIRSLEQVKGVTASDEHIVLNNILNGMTDVEVSITKALEKAMKKHPLGPWIKTAPGIGLKQGARLLGTIGDPYIRMPVEQHDGSIEESRPRRGPAELWAYCGYHVVDGKRPKAKKGVQSNWKSHAKMRAYNCAESAVKAGVRKLDGVNDEDGYDLEHRKAISKYGEVYLNARQNWGDKDTSDRHKHNHALSLVAKEILKDLFLESKRLHEQSTCEAHNHHIAVAA